MRKTSQDGGDSTSITSGIENEMKKSGPGILKSTKNSIKRKVQNFSNESDDTANEPLLHKEKSEIEKQSAKFLISKTKTDYGNEKGDDKDKLLADEKIAKPSITNVIGITDAIVGNGVKVHSHVTSHSIHNHMNTNVFHRPDSPITATAKTQILVELDTSKPTKYSPSPLIFTTAKIHTDGKVQQMEPVQVTPVPILSTIEGGLVKTATKGKESGSQHTRDKTNTTVTSSVATISKLPEKNDINVTSNVGVSNTSLKTLTFGSKGLTDNKDEKSVPTQSVSQVISSKTTNAQISNSQATLEDSMRTKISEPLSQDSVGAKLVGNDIHEHDSQNVSISNDFSSSLKKEFMKSPAPTQTTSTTDRSYVDINKNFQPKCVPEVKKDVKNDCTESSTKGFSSNTSAKADKTTSVSNTKDFKSNNQDSKITTSEVKIPIKEQAKSGSAAKLSPATSSSIEKVNTGISTEISINKADSAVLAKPTSIATMPNITKSAVKDQSQILTKSENTTSTTLSESSVCNTTATSIVNNTQPVTCSNSVKNPQDKECVTNNVKIENTMKPIEITSSTNKGKSMKSPMPAGGSILTTESSLPTTSLPSNNRSIGKDKETLASAPKTTSKETSAQKILVSDKKAAPDISSSSTSITAPSNAKSTVNISPQPIPNTKNTVSTPVVCVNKTSVSSTISTNSKTSSIVKTTADDIGNKYKSNNVATVVSSISKPTTTVFNANSTRPSILMTTSKTPTSVKQSTSSTVKTISSIPTAKSSILSTVPHEKKSTKASSTPVNNEQMSTKSGSSTTRNVVNTKDSNTVKVTPSAKVKETSSTKPTTKSSSQSEVKPRENTKDSKGSKA